MIYLNGQIGAVYMDGHYHSEVYLGSVLVWQNVKKIPGEAHAQLAFENTADGVSVVLLPGNAEGKLMLIPAAKGIPTQTVAPEVHSGVRTEADAVAEGGAASDSGARQEVALSTSADGDAVTTEHGAAGQSIALHTPKPPSEDIAVKGSTVAEALGLHTPNSPADAILYKDDVTGQVFDLHTPKPPVENIAAKSGETGVDVLLQTPSVPGQGVIVEKDHMNLDLQIDTVEPPAEPVNAADTVGAAGVKVTTPATTPGDGLAVDGAAEARAGVSASAVAGNGIAVGAAAEAQAKVSADAVPGDASGVSTAGQAGVNVNTESVGSAGAIAEGQSIGQLKAETQAEPEALGLMAAAVDEKTAFVSQVVGKAVGWLDPVKSGKLLYVRQVYSAAIKQDGVLGNILEAT